MILGGAEGYANGEVMKTTKWAETSPTPAVQAVAHAIGYKLHERRAYLSTVAMIKDAKSRLSGLHLFIRFGKSEYPANPGDLMRVLDMWTDIAKLGGGRNTIRYLLAMARNCERQRKIVLKRGWIEKMTMQARAVLEGIARAETRVTRETENILGDYPGSIDPSTQPMKFILIAAAWYCRIPHKRLSAKTRCDARTADVRMVIYKLIFDLRPDKTVTSIARFFNRDHTTILHGFKRVAGDPRLMQIHAALHKILSPHFPEAVAERETVDSGRDPVP